MRFELRMNTKRMQILLSISSPSKILKTYDLLKNVSSEKTGSFVKKLLKK